MLLLSIKQPKKLEKMAVRQVKIPELERVKKLFTNIVEPNYVVSYVKVNKTVAVVR